MSFHFAAAGSPEEVVAQLMSADVSGDPLGAELRDLILRHLQFPKIIGPQDRYVFTLRASGSTSLGALTSLHVDTEAVWVPYVRADVAEKARLFLQGERPVPEGD